MVPLGSGDCRSYTGSGGWRSWPPSKHVDVRYVRDQAAKGKSVARLGTAVGPGFLFFQFRSQDPVFEQDRSDRFILVTFAWAQPTCQYYHSRKMLQGAFLKQGPLQTLLAQYYPQSICIDLFSCQYRSPSGSCTTRDDTSPLTMMKSRPSQEIVRPSSYHLREHGDPNIPLPQQRISINQPPLLQVRGGSVILYGVSRDAPVHSNRLCVSRWLLL
jgi:hypothetical protein